MFYKSEKKLFNRMCLGNKNNKRNVLVWNFKMRESPGKFKNHMVLKV